MCFFHVSWGWVKTYCYQFEWDEDLFTSYLKCSLGTRVLTHSLMRNPPKSSSVQDLRPESRPKASPLVHLQDPFHLGRLLWLPRPKGHWVGVEASMEGFTNKHAAELWKLGGSDSLSLLKMGQYIQIYNKTIYSLFIGLPPNDAEGRFWWGDDNMYVYIYICMYVCIYIYIWPYIIIYIHTYHNYPGEGSQHEWIQYQTRSNQKPGFRLEGIEYQG